MGDCSWRWLWGGADTADIWARGGGWLWVWLHGNLWWLWQHCTPPGTLLWLRGKLWWWGFHRHSWRWQGRVLSYPFWRGTALMSWWWGCGVCLVFAPSPVARDNSRFVWCPELVWKPCWLNFPVQQHRTATLLCPSPAAKALCWKQLPKASFILSHYLPEAFLQPCYGEGAGWREFQTFFLTPGWHDVS